MRKPSLISNRNDGQDERKAKEVLFDLKEEQESFEKFNFSGPSEEKKEIADPSKFKEDQSEAFDDNQFRLKTNKKFIE